ncbi:hypothetical protein [Neorhodopirellula pilleata]|uniref:Uncharacterized protein n=1 Tax=Neorhodopirellula pilleata TaxID=2714738 RepID=A0A5C5ZXT5_9BACT|nr:hypothetical protein [Neorhodopirellula pilleata]TWT91811.1 hypothetical protein Pla100_48490 [Neorhodopirellula pilleata]
MSRYPESNRNASTAFPKGDGGTSLDRAAIGHRPAIQQRISRIMIVLTFIALCMVGTGLMLRFAVSQLNDRQQIILEADVRPTSHPIESTLKAQADAAEALRDQARAFDERLLSERRDRQWVYETRDLPDSGDARRMWQDQVDEIEAQIAEAEQLQTTIEANLENSDDPKPLLFEEGSVLHGRLKHLERLREDAPPE